MAAITIPGENLIAQKQANNELLAIDQFVLANIPNLNPEDPVDREEQLPPSSQIVLQEQVSQMGYISPNLVVYSLMLDTGGEKFDFNWIGLYASDDDVVVSIAYLPTQTKDPSVAMTRNFMLEFSGAAETTDINIDAESWQVDFSARMDGTDERVRQLSEDTIGRQLFYGDACKVSSGENGYYKVASGTGHVAGIRFNYVEKSVLVTKFPSSIWMDVWQRKNSMSDIEPEAVAVVSQTDRVDYLDGDGVWHYLEKVAEVEIDDRVIDYRRVNKQVLPPAPDFNLSLISDLHIRQGFGFGYYERSSGAYETNNSGKLIWRDIHEARHEKKGVLIEGISKNVLLRAELTEGGTGGHIDSADDLAGEISGWHIIQTSEGTPKSIVFACDVSSFSEHANFSIYCKKSESDNFRLEIRGTSPEKSIQVNWIDGVPVHNEIETEYIALGWHRLSFNISDLSFTKTITIKISGWNKGKLGGTIFCFPQLEPRPFSTSYIPSVNTELTREADIFKVTLENNVVQPSNGMTISADVSFIGGAMPPDNSGINTRSVFNIGYKLSKSLSLHFDGSSTFRCIWNSSDASWFSPNIPTEERGDGRYVCVVGPNQAPMYFKGVKYARTVKAIDITTDPISISIGCNTAGHNQLWGWIKNFEIRHTELSDEQAMSLLGSN
ncbi:MAG: phage tail protein [Gammaproteobacteria bacterium]|nr:phage tail protein [Gammaproteobacteria bacterium]